MRVVGVVVMMVFLSAVEGAIDGVALQASILSGDQFVCTTVQNTSTRVGPVRLGRVVFAALGHAFRSITGPRCREAMHGGLCTAGTHEIQQRVADQQVQNIIAPLERAGLVVDVVLAFYEQPRCNASWFFDLERWYQSNPARSHGSVTVLRTSSNDQWQNRIYVLEHLRARSLLDGGGWEYVILYRFDLEPRWGSPRLTTPVRSSSELTTRKTPKLTFFSHNDDQRVSFPWSLLTCISAVHTDCQLAGPATHRGELCAPGPFDFRFASVPTNAGLRMYMGMDAQLLPSVNGTLLRAGISHGSGKMTECLYGPVPTGMHPDNKDHPAWADKTRDCGCDLYPATLTDSPGDWLGVALQESLRTAL